MRQRMERIRNADMGIGLAAHFGCHHKSHYARHVGLVRQRDHVEHQIDVLIEIGNADRNVGQFIHRHVARFHVMHSPLDLTHTVEVAIQYDLVGGAQALFQVAGFFPHHVQHAFVVVGDARAFLIGAAFTKQLREKFLGAVFHRQRAGRRAE